MALVDEGLRPAPELALANQFGETVALSGLAGRPVIVVFFPFAFSAVCTAELAGLNGMLPEFDAAGVRLLGVSCDSRYTLRAYRESGGYGFDLLSDFWPHGAAARAYDAFDEVRGLARRRSFVIDGQGRIQASVSSSAGTARPLDAYRQALEALAARAEPDARTDTRTKDPSHAG